MQYFCEDEERTGTIAQAESHHLDENQDDCEDVEAGHKNLDEGNQQQGNDYYPLTLHHESSASVLLQKLASEEGYSHLQQVQVHENWEYIRRLISISNLPKGHTPSKISKSSSS